MIKTFKKFKIIEYHVYGDKIKQQIYFHYYKAIIKKYYSKIFEIRIE